MYNPFTKHPHSVGETYFEHMRKAVSYGLRIQLISLIVFIHATFPFLFEDTAGDEIEKINKELQHRRNNGQK
tara:strand:+ start:665 stop:880 length:216 start_codon:yes stop_codon:yes gene_type:complete